MTTFTEAAKALVRTAYTDGRYTGPTEAAAAVQSLGHWLRAGAPVGAIDQAQAAELLASGAPTLALQVTPIDPTPDAA